MRETVGQKIIFRIITQIQVSCYECFVSTDEKYYFQFHLVLHCLWTRAHQAAPNSGKWNTEVV